MRIARATHRSETIFGTVDAPGDNKAAQLTDLREFYADATELLVAAQDAAGREQITATAQLAPRRPVGELQLLPPIPNPTRILCVGTNYVDHVAESDRVVDKPDQPMIFARFPSSLVGHGAPLERPPESSSFDYEGELAIVIGHRTRRATRENAIDAIGGYSCFMDGTIRDWQRHTSQFIPGKSFERSGAWGPWIVTADEVGDPYDLQLRTTLDGQQMQAASLRQLIFDLQDIIVYCSTFTALEPGDVIATGTPGGVGYAQDPPRWLKPGNEIVVEVPGIGRLENPIIDEPTIHAPKCEDDR